MLQTASAATPPRILLVDDDATSLEAMARQLGRRYRVVTASQPAEALARLRDGSRIDAIVSDLQMPVMSGIAFLQAASTIAPHASRILLSGHIDLDAAMAAVNRAGVARVLSKPTSPAVIADILDQIIVPDQAPAPADAAITEAGIATALAAGEFTVSFAPKAPTDVTRPLAFDAEVVWRRPGDRVIPLSRYMPMLERSALIDRIVSFILTEVCTACAAWRSRLGRHVVVGLSLPTAVLARDGFAVDLRSRMLRHGLPPDAVEIEIAEGSSLLIPRPLAGNSPSGNSVTHETPDGTGIPDDGTTQSVLIDRSFVHRIEYSRIDADLVRSIVALARRLGLRTTADGVETTTQAAILTEIGCDYLRGNLIGRPMTASDTERWLTAGSVPQHESCLK